MREIYLDCAALAPLRSEVRQVMDQAMDENFGNPSSIHHSGQRAKIALETARAEMKEISRAQNAQIFFTSGGTESANLAVFGIMQQFPLGSHCITSLGEHSAVLKSFFELEKRGYRVTYVPINEYGQVELETFVQAVIPGETVFASIQYANSETGSINDILPITHVCKKHTIILHSDACQIVTTHSIDFEALGIDILTVNSSKIGGPRGVGALFVKKHIALQASSYGGGQEHGIRSGTENLISILGFAAAWKLAQTEASENAKILRGHTDYFLHHLQSKMTKIICNSHPIQRLPHFLHLSFLGYEAEYLLHCLSERGIYVSTGSACTEKEAGYSSVLQALPYSRERKEGSLRLSFCREITYDDLDYLAQQFFEVLEGSKVQF